LKFALHLIVIVLLGCLSYLKAADDPSLAAQDIMAKVAVNQDRADKLRSEYVYHQHVRIVTRKSSKILREEMADYSITPTADGTERKLESLAGRYWHKGRYIEFKGEPVPEADSLDGDLIHDFRQDLADQHSKDGLAKDYFPLTTEEQKKYQFRLIGTETLQGRDVYHLGFRPNDKDEFTWAGEAYIDRADFAPVTVFTKLSKPLPFLVRALLVDLPGVGFNVQYRRQPDGVWFPTSFGTEFRFRLFMFWTRDITISLENTAFEHTHVESRIKAVEAIPH